VATVDSTGLVTGVTTGTATITATTEEGGFTDTCVVTVNPANVPVSGVTLTPKTLALDVNTTPSGQLTATVAPADATNPAVTYVSSNEAVATVNTTGLVTAVAAGTATITVTTTDGGFTDTCLVTVTAPVLAPALTALDAETVTPTSDNNTVSHPELAYEAGPTLGGNQVILTGTNLTGVSTVKFGSADATNFTINSDTQITAVAPAGSAGEVQVTVVASDGTTVSNGLAYRYASWEISGTVYYFNPATFSVAPLAGATIYMRVNAADPFYDPSYPVRPGEPGYDPSLDPNDLGTAITAADGTYTRCTAFVRGAPLPVGTIIEVSAACPGHVSITQFSRYDRPTVLCDFKRFLGFDDQTGTLKEPEEDYISDRWLIKSTTVIPPPPFEWMLPNYITNIN
jgi:hypothetical protein